MQVEVSTLRSIVSNLRNRRAGNIDTQWRENTNERFNGRRGGWLTWGSDLETYSFSFEAVTGINIQAYFQDIQGLPKIRNVLDLMADETAVLDAVGNFEVERGLAVSLGFGSEQNTDIDSNDRPVGTVNGDLLFRETWRDIRKWMNLKGIEAFDLIISRPEGGLGCLTESPVVHWRLLTRAWNLLSDQNGVLLFQVPKYERWLFWNYTRELLDAGIVVQFDRDGEYDYGNPALLIKRESSPKDLPLPGLIPNDVWEKYQQDMAKLK